MRTKIESLLRLLIMTSRVVLIASMWLMLPLIVRLTASPIYTISSRWHLGTSYHIVMRHCVMLVLLIPLGSVLLIRAKGVAVIRMTGVLLLLLLLLLLVVLLSLLIVMLLSVSISRVLVLLPRGSLRWGRRRRRGGRATICISTKGIRGVKLPLWSWLERTPLSRPGFVHLVPSPVSLRKIAFVRTDIHATSANLVALPIIGTTHESYRLSASVQPWFDYSFVFVHQHRVRQNRSGKHDALVGQFRWLGKRNTDAVVFRNCLREQVVLACHDCLRGEIRCGDNLGFRNDFVPERRTERSREARAPIRSSIGKPLLRRFGGFPVLQNML
mmetsp:Transcript_10860/g.23082  ORF Transcript_10860/g.23082 Transcript_10860/m.23082 type:complete len:328 (+) Transcript_10860:266-1249(+)